MKAMLSLYNKQGTKSLADTASGTLSARLNATSYEILNTLFENRQLCSLPARPSQWGVCKPSIAICLVIVDTLMHEDIWKAWLTSKNQDIHVQFYIHAKHPDKIRSEWVRSKLITEHFTPEWNSPEVVRAMLALLCAAVNDSNPCERFVFGTESCIPVVSVETAVESLFQEDVSWLQATNQPKNNWEHIHCFRSVDPSVVPPKAVWKAVPGWIMLTRRHAAEIVALNTRFASQLGDLVSAWGSPGQWSDSKGGVFAPEEVFFPTMLALLGYLDANKMQLAEQHQKEGKAVSASKEICLKSVTFAEFERNGDANPKTYPTLTAQLVQTVRDAGALFARKFSGDSVSLREWSRLVLNNNDAISSSRLNWQESNHSRNSSTADGDRRHSERDSHHHGDMRDRRKGGRSRSRSRSRDRQRGGGGIYFDRDNSRSDRNNDHQKDTSRGGMNSSNSRYSDRGYDQASYTTSGSTYHRNNENNYSSGSARRSHDNRHDSSHRPTRNER